MTLSSDFTTTSSGPTTTLPGSIDIAAVLPELTTPQERFDHGYKRGYMAGYAEGARQAKAERAAELESQKADRAASQAQGAALLSQLATATDKYLQVYGPREAQFSDELVGTAFELAEAIVAREMTIRPDRALAMARAVLGELPTGPAMVRVNPLDEPLLTEAVATLGNGAQKVTVVADPAIGRGGCTVTSGATKVDARLPEALARAREAFCTADEADDPSPGSLR